jgi:heavy metal sensor kinase
MTSGAASAPARSRFRRLRTRITAWYGAIIAVCLIAYSAAVGTSFMARVQAELDHRVHEDIELASRAILVDDRGRLSWPRGFLDRQVHEEEGGGHWIEVLSLGGERLLTLGTRETLSLPSTEGASGSSDSPRTLRLPAGPVRVMTESIEVEGKRFLVRAAVSEAGARKQVRRLWLELAALSLTVLAFGGLGGFLLARRALGPLARMADHARRITAEQLSERLSLEKSSTEVDQVRDAFNDTLARLEYSFDQLRRFTADASHELRTPLTALRSVGEVGLRRAKTAEDYREVIGTMLEEVDRLSRLSDVLLMLARADARRAQLRREPVDLSTLACEVAGQLSVLAEERGQTLAAHSEGPVLVEGDRLALRQALLNLVDNAIKYSPEGTRVGVVAGKRRNRAFVEVRDEGPGIAPEHRERIFERFYRVEGSRSREMGGSGLGLSLVKWAAEAHAGRVELETEEGEGSTFRLVLPITQPLATSAPRKKEICGSYTQAE